MGKNIEFTSEFLKEDVMNKLTKQDYSIGRVLMPFIDILAIKVLFKGR